MRTVLRNVFYPKVPVKLKFRRGIVLSIVESKYSTDGDCSIFVN